MKPNQVPAPERVEVPPPENFPVFHALVTQLSEDDPKLRSSAVWTLGQLRYWPSIRLITRVLRYDEDSLVRMQAARALARMKSSGSAQALIQGLNDQDDLVQYTCVVGLGNLRDPQAIYPLQQFRKKLEDSDDLVRTVEWATNLLLIAEEPGFRPDRRRGGVSKKIRKYLEKVDASPRDGIAHNNLAVAYFHAAELELAQRHCRLAKELGAHVQKLWQDLVGAEHDPGSLELSREDELFLSGKGGSPETVGALSLTREPKRTELKRPKTSEQADSAKPAAMGAYRIADHREVAAPPGKRSRTSSTKESRPRKSS